MAVHHSAHVQIQSAPLPPPDVLRGYEAVLEGAADRIIRMAETEQKQRHDNQRRQARLSVVVVLAGQMLGFLLALAGVIGGIVMVLNGRSVAGYSSVLTCLATLAGVFVYSHRSSRTK